jgi:hypothetical protein
LHFRRRESDRQIFEFFVIQRQDDKSEMAKIGTRKAVEPRFRERFRQLDFAFAAAAAKDDRVAIANAAEGVVLRIHQDDGFKRVICLSRTIQFSNGIGKRAGSARERVVCHRVFHVLSPV